MLYGLSEHSSAAVTDLLVSLKHDDERLEPSTPKLKARKRAQDKLDGPGLPPLVGPILEAAGRLADVLRFSIVIPTLAYVDRVREIVRNWVRIITAPQECDVPGSRKGSQAIGGAMLPYVPLWQSSVGCGTRFSFIHRSPSSPLTRRHMGCTRSVGTLRRLHNVSLSWTLSPS